MLKPQKNTDAETLVNWIETGVHEALEHRYLATMKFGVCSNPEQSKSLIACGLIRDVPVVLSAVTLVLFLKR